MKITALNGIHHRLGARLIDFNGWEMPVQYKGILEEHIAVRTAAGLFDVSHMGEIAVEGQGAAAFLQRLLTNDIDAAIEGQVVYSPMCFPDGGVVDDLLVYKFNSVSYLLVVNAANSSRDYDWIRDALFQYNDLSVNIRNLSDEYAQIALQGPESDHILQKLCHFPLSEIKRYRFKKDVSLNSIISIVSRTGYTGEDGFEIYLSPSDAPLLWEMIIAAGEGAGLMPIGLGARDTLRFEACLPLYGNEISETISPLEAGLDKFVRFDKPEFTGRQAMLDQKINGIPRTLFGFEMVDRGIARSHYEVFSSGAKIGFVTSGSYSPTFGKNLGLALVENRAGYESSLDDKGILEFDILVRSNLLKAKRIATPFYLKGKKH